MVNHTTLDKVLPYASDPLSSLASIFLNSESTITKIRSGNQFYLHIRPLVESFVFTQRSIPFIFESIVVDKIMERVFIQLNSFQFKSRLTTWVYRVSRNICLDFQKTKIFKGSTIIKSVELARNENTKIFSNLVEINSPESILISLESKQKINDALKKIDKTDQKKIKMIFFDGFTSKQVCEILNLEKSNLSHRKKRILLKLKSILQK